MSSLVPVVPLGKGLFRMLEDRTDQLIKGDQPWSHTINKGFITDFGSVPWLLQWVYKPTEKWLIVASLHHDQMYRSHSVSREVADGFLKQLCKEHGATFTQRTLVWLAVTLAGDKAYREAGQSVESADNE